jgi:type II restriction enzyme
MRAAIESDRVPNLLVLHYSAADWHVQNLMLIPSFCFSVSALEKRRPLAPTARRAGWVGCNILLAAIPFDARIKIVDNSEIIPAATIRNRFAALQPLQSIEPNFRGWTLDVLRYARSLRQERFSLKDMYRFESELQAVHPENRHVRQKIRQQLQVLRDADIIRFLGRGIYEFVAPLSSRSD